MKTLPNSKACNLKGNQKVFYLQVNQVASCCRAHSSPLDATRNIGSYINEWTHEQQQLIAGVELDGCQSCWQNENQGRTSYRQQTTEAMSNVVELYISNLCNHMCSYCSPKYSSVWEDSINTYGVFQNISTSAKNNLTQHQALADIPYWITQISEYINTCDDDSVFLLLGGGEPLMQQRNLERLLSFNSNKIKTLSIHTNLNPPTNKFLQWILDNTDNNKLKVTISLDASPAYNDIPRAGFDETKFLLNLELLKHNNIEFHFNAVVSVLSLFDLENFINWRDTNEFKIKFTQLYNPDCLSPQYIPFAFRQKIWNNTKHLDLPLEINEILGQQEKLVDLKLFEQYNYLNQYFNRNNIDPVQINNTLFVEYWNWLSDYTYKKFKQ